MYTLNKLRACCRGSLDFRLDFGCGYEFYDVGG